MKNEESQYLIVSKTDIIEIKETLGQILNNLSQNGQSRSLVPEYLGQLEAEKFLNKKTTWFWQMRKAGKLQYRKLGNKNYYKKSELELLFKNQ